MPIYRYTPVWSGFSGAPGYTNFHFAEPTPPTTQQVADMTARVRTFLGAVGPYLPSVVRIDYPTVVEQLDTATGSLTGEVTVPALSATTGVSGAAFPNGVGACISWKTSLVLDGRRLLGRTFLVPLAVGAYAADGTLDTGFRSAVLAAAETFRSATGPLPLVVWHKPNETLGIVGASAQVSAATMTDKTAVLRSRRD